MAEELSPSTPQSRRHHALRDAGDAHAIARYDDRQRGAAAHAGKPGGEPGPDRLGADLLYRGRGDRDAAHRLSHGAARPQAAVHRVGGRLHHRLHALRHGAVGDRDRAIPLAAGPLRRRAGAALADGAAQHQPAGASRLGDGGLGHGGDGGADPRARARRLADRGLQLALGVLHQPADRCAHLHRHDRSSCRRRGRRTRRGSTGPAS